MRIWSLHPCYLDAKGLVALWRETLLAKHVLAGDTRGYRHHPQLQRFQVAAEPLRAIHAYLGAVHAEACTRGYRFDASKFTAVGPVPAIPVTRGQMAYEWQHLRHKLQQRDSARWAACRDWPPESLMAHPLFRVVDGDVEAWEVRKP